MTEEAEPRRSGRATKGKHTRNIEHEESTPPPTKKTNAKKKKATAAKSTTPDSEDNNATDTDKEGDNEVVLCICGATDDSGGRQMISCDICEIWYHSSCMGISIKNTPDEFICIKCRPDLHPVLVEKIARGEKPWDKKGKGRKSVSRRSIGGDTPEKAEGRTTRRSRGLSQAVDRTVEDTTEHEEKESEQDEKGNIQEQSEERTDAQDEEANVDQTQPVEQKPNNDNIEAKTEEDDGVNLDRNGISAPMDAGDPADKQDVSTDQVEDKMDTDLTTQPAESALNGNMKPPQDMNEAGMDDIVAGEEQQGETPSKTRPPPLRTTSTSSHNNEVMAPPMTPLTPATPAPALQGRKRKADESGTDTKEGPPSRRTSLAQAGTKPEKPKRRQSSTSKPAPKKTKPVAPNQTELVSSVSELLSEFRRKGAEMIGDIFKSRIEDEKHIVPEDEPDLQSFAIRLGLEIEHYTYMLLSASHPGEPNDEYRTKCRSILFNLKQNKNLRNGLIKKDISTEAFTKLTNDEMATDEIMEQVQAAKEESEKQATLITDVSGPRVRRTHKGEEIVGEDTGLLGESNVSFIGTRYEGNANESKEEEDKSRPPTPALEDTEMVDDNSKKTPPTKTEAPTEEKPVIAENLAKPAAHRRTSSNFDISNVWSTIDIQDPDKAQQRYNAPKPSGLSHNYTNAAREDKDVDMLLQDLDTGSQAGSVGTPPYSPKDYDALPDGVVWRGNFNMRGVAEVEGDAVRVGGPDVSAIASYDEVFGSIVNITGRIQIPRASYYLEQLRMNSRSNDLLAFMVTPSSKYTYHAENGRSFDKLCDHFKERERYGVVGEPKYSRNKDMYIVSVHKDDDLPEFLRDMDIPPKPRKQNIIVLCIVFSKSTDQGVSDSPTGQVNATPQAPNRSAQTPLTLPRPDMLGQQSPTQNYVPQDAIPWQQQQFQSPYQQPAYGSPATHPAGMPTQPFEHQYQPPGLGHQETQQRQHMQQQQPTPEEIDNFMRQCDISTKNESMIRNLLKQNPKVFENPNALKEFVAKYDLAQLGR